MSVIGRLDDQVNEKLIEPLARRNPRETNEQEDEKAASSAPANVELDESKTEIKRDDLPVWLL